MIISVKWNDKNSTFKIGEYIFKCVYNLLIIGPRGLGW